MSQSCLMDYSMKNNSLESRSFSSFQLSPRSSAIQHTAREIDIETPILLAHTTYLLYTSRIIYHHQHRKILIDDMDSFTSACLAPTMPANGSLESIGSVRAMHERANAETAEKSDFGKFQKER